MSPLNFTRSSGIAILTTNYRSNLLVDWARGPRHQSLCPKHSSPRVRDSGIDCACNLSKTRKVLALSLKNPKVVNRLAVALSPITSQSTSARPKYTSTPGRFSISSPCTSPKLSSTLTCLSAPASRYKERTRLNTWHQSWAPSSLTASFRTFT